MKTEIREPNFQLKFLKRSEKKIDPFHRKMDAAGLYPLYPKKTEILQINLGYLCNQSCNHCHVDAGPGRKEIMSRETMEECLSAIKKAGINTVDLTGGAPEMNPNFLWFIEALHQLSVQIIIRSNLTILVSNKHFRQYPERFKEYGITVIASLPCYTEENTDKQRGNGVFNGSIKALQILNSLGYGQAGSGLHLHLVYNPGGAFLPGEQKALEKDYKEKLKAGFGIEFNDLYTITNLPISRFLIDLVKQNKYEEYMSLLANSFNPKAAGEVMCRNTLSVGWDGQLYDCDFNQMLGLKVNNKYSQHIHDINWNCFNERPIMLQQHCYGCTAGAGSSCQGSLT